MDTGQVRDWVLIVTGVVWAIIFLVILLVTVTIYYFVHKYMAIGRGYLHVQVREFLGQVQDQAELVRQQTAALPRYEGAVAPEVSERARRPMRLRLPFRRKRHWWEKVLPG
jgi:hypothetical protein